MESEQARIHFVLVRTRNPLNLGAAARALSNFGFLSLRVVNPYDPSFQEARSAVGASQVLSDAKVFNSVAEAVSDCSLVIGTTAAHNRELQQPLQLLPESSERIRVHAQSGTVAILFGSERVGLSKDDLTHCHTAIRIPTRLEHLSMNLGQAVAVVAYEITRISITTHAATPEPAQGRDLERLGAGLKEILDSSEYFTPGAKIGAEQKLRLLIRRLNPSQTDAQTLLGMVGKIMWKINKH